MSFLFPSTRITFDAALRDLTSKNAKARIAAAHALGDARDEDGERERAMPALIAALADDRFEVRAEACGALGQIVEIGEAEARAALEKRLTDGSAAVRQAAAIALGTIGDPAAFAALAESLATGPADARFQAATSLAEVDPTRAYDPLVAALADSDPQVVGAAALAIGALAESSGARGVAVLTERLASADAAARFDIAYALAELGSDAGRAVLLAAASDADRAWDAVTALGWLAARVDPRDTTGGRDRDSEDALAAVMIDKRAPVEAALLAAGRLLVAAPDHARADAARRALIDQLQARKIHVRSLAVEQLGEVGAAWALAPLQELAGSRRGDEVADAVSTALRKIHERTG